MSSQELLPAVSGKEEITFAEVPVPVNKADRYRSDMQDSIIHPVAVIKTENYSIALSGDISDSLLVRILGEVFHA